MSSLADGAPQRAYEPIAEGMMTQGEMGKISPPSVFSIRELLGLVLTPLLAPIVGYLTAWVGTHFPGIHVDPNQTTDLVIAGIAFVLGLALKALHSKDVRVGAQAGRAVALTPIAGQLSLSAGHSHSRRGDPPPAQS